MSIPRQVEKAAVMAEAYIGSLQADPKENPPAAPPEEENTSALDTPPRDEEEVIEPPEDKQDPSPKEPEVDWEQKYKTLAGMHKAEETRLRDELKEFKQSVFDRLGSLEAPAPKDDEPEPQISETLAQFREEYGEEFIEGVKELLRAEISPLLKQTVAPVEQKVASVEEAQLKSAQKAFAQDLSSRVNGDWQSLWGGQDAKFNEFLASSDPSGLYTYRELADLYSKNWNVEKLATLFNTYLGQGQVQPAPKPKPSAGKEALVAPSRRTPPAAPAAEEKIQWTQARIKEFQAKDRRGEYDEATSQKMWTDLLSAVSENRIR